MTRTAIALVLALAFVPAASARRATPHPLDTQAVSSVVFYLELPIWAHNVARLHPVYFRGTCSTHLAVTPTNTAWKCNFYGYNRRHGRLHRILHVPLSVRTIVGHRRTESWEDGSVNAQFDRTQWLKIRP